MTPLLIHYHIFKNAGSSFEWALDQALGEGFSSLDTSSSKGFVSGDDLAAFAARHPAVRAISSHQAAPPAPHIPEREVFTSILIRDPIARIRSIYSFERTQVAPSPGATKAKELIFRQYVEWRLETAPLVFCNYQVNFCLRTAKPLRPPLNLQHLEQALANLEDISFVGTVARYNEWLALAEKILSKPFPNLKLVPTKRNVTTQHVAEKSLVLERLIADLGHSTVEYLLAQNELDIRLHQAADATLTKRLADCGLVRSHTKDGADEKISLRGTPEQTIGS